MTSIGDTRVWRHRESIPGLEFLLEYKNTGKGTGWYIVARRYAKSEPWTYFSDMGYELPND